MPDLPEGLHFSLIPVERVPPLEASYPLSKTEISVGRHPTNDVAIPLDSVSRFHARITLRGDEFHVVDLGSSNGTFINNNRAEEGPLADEDQVRFGNVAFTFARTEPEPPKVKEPGSESQVRLVDEDDALMQSVVQKFTKSETTQSTVFRREMTDAGSLSRARKLLNTLYDFHKRLGGDTDARQVYATMLDLIFDALPCDRGVILTRDDVQTEFRPVHSMLRGREVEGEIAISKTILDRCLTERVAILSRDAMTDRRFNQAASVMLHDIRSAMCAPLISRDTVLALCFVDASESKQSFGEADLEFFSALAAEVAILLDNAQLTEEMALNKQLAAIGQTITGMAHNIKNVLLLTQGGIELMDNCLEKKNHDALDKTWTVIKRGLDRINNMVKEMLEFSRKREAVKTEADVNRIIRETIEFVRKDLENKSIHLITDLDESIPRRLIDEEGFYKAFMNLLVNASEAVEEGRGRIGVRTQLAPDGAIRLLVQDNGCGIPPEHLQRVFLPFFTTKGSRGTGLGLSMTRKIIDSMGGRIRCKSQVDVGTAFEIVLPPDSSTSTESGEVKTRLVD